MTQSPRMFTLTNPRTDEQSRAVYDLHVDGRLVKIGLTYDEAVTFCVTTMAGTDLYQEPGMPGSLTGGQLRRNHQELKRWHESGGAYRPQFG